VHAQFLVDEDGDTIDDSIDPCIDPNDPMNSCANASQVSTPEDGASFESSPPPLAPPEEGAGGEARVSQADFCGNSVDDDADGAMDDADPEGCVPDEGAFGSEEGGVSTPEGSVSTDSTATETEGEVQGGVSQAEICGNTIDDDNDGATDDADPEGCITDTQTIDYITSTLGCSSQPMWSINGGTYNKGPWSFNYQIINGQGLVLSNIKAGNEHLFDSISVPHFKVDYQMPIGTGLSKIIRFCDPNDPSSSTMRYEPSPSVTVVDETRGIDRLSWEYIVEGDSFPELAGRGSGKLHIIYDIAIMWKPTKNCEPQEISCLRFVPKVQFIWDPPKEIIDKMTAFYRLDYGQGVVLAPIQDADWAITGVFQEGGQFMQQKEAVINAVKDGRAGQIDNTHTAHVGQMVHIPGCRSTIYDCVHMHWRWSDIKASVAAPSTFGNFVDPEVEPSTGEDISHVDAGTPYLVPLQTIDIGFVKYNQGEDPDPDDPFTLVDGERLATTVSRGGLTDPEKGFVVSTSEHPIVWYVASVQNRDTDTFFRHGFFVLEVPPDPCTTAILCNPRG
jgi:hypothetical protein